VVIAALISFGILLVAWILAPERSTQQQRQELQTELVGVALGEASAPERSRFALERKLPRVSTG
jgi:hypothetical protein